MSDVVVLGCGPAGLVAAHAATIAGHRIQVWSRKRKSEMFGAQYLHAPIPDITERESVMMQYDLWGDADAYRRKVYGETYTGTVSPEDLIGEHEAWDIREAYSRLWERFAPSIIDVDLSDPDTIKEAIAISDITINTIPLPTICQKLHDEWEPHGFTSQQVWAVGDAPERGTFCPVQVNPNSVICNGFAEPAWYRASNVFGHSSVEWPHDRKPPFEGIAEVSKPVSTNCTCWSDSILRVGRYGAWRKGMLVSDVFAAVVEELG